MEGAGGSAAGRRISAAAGFRTGAAAGLHMGAVILASIAENPYKCYITSNKIATGASIGKLDDRGGRHKAMAN